MWLCLPWLSTAFACLVTPSSTHPWSPFSLRCGYSWIWMFKQAIWKEQRSHTYIQYSLAILSYSEYSFWVLSTTFLQEKPQPEHISDKSIQEALGQRKGPPKSLCPIKCYGRKLVSIILPVSCQIKCWFSGFEAVWEFSADDCCNDLCQEQCRHQHHGIFGGWVMTWSISNRHGHMRVHCNISFSASGSVEIRAGKSKSLIRWKRLKGGKRRKKAEKANLIYN